MVAQALNVETIDATVVKETLPMRKADGHKGDFGKDYILAGSVALRAPRCWRPMRVPAWGRDW